MGYFSSELDKTVVLLYECKYIKRSVGRIKRSYKQFLWRRMREAEDFKKIRPWSTLRVQK